MLTIPLLTDVVKLTANKHTVTDSVDYLNYVVTATLIGVFALATSAKQYFGNPIECYSYLNSGDGRLHSYANSYCFVANSYYLQQGNEFTSTHGTAEREDHISYYRWVPILLAVQCACFWMPNFVWNAFHKRTAMNPEGFIKEAEKVAELTGNKREEELDKLAKYFMETISIFGSSDYKKRLRLNPLSGKNAIRLYLCVKLLYLLNIFAQFYLLGRFIGNGFFGWGFDHLYGMINGNETYASHIFPRNIFCDYTIRALGNEELYSIQCVMMMNMINEKLFLFLYFWFLFLGLITFINFLYYLMLLVLPLFRYRAVLVKIDEFRRIHSLGEIQSREIKRFVHECLHPDGVLLLQFVGEHIGTRLAYDLANRVLAMYTSQDSDSSVTPYIGPCGDTQHKKPAPVTNRFDPPMLNYSIQTIGETSNDYGDSSCEKSKV